MFSFEKLTDVDTGLGRMKSHRRVPEPGRVLPQALLKAFKGAGMKGPKKNRHIIITVRVEDKDEIIGIARELL